jgi:D-amino-acid dehydrogenase
MKIAVIGAGIVGITTAYELALDGHEVTVFERRLAAAEEASFANAGIVSPGYVTPWATPGMPLKVIQYLFSRHSPVRISWPLAPRDLGWMWKFLRACKHDTYATNRTRLQRLALYSRDRLDRISADLRLDYDRSLGSLVLLRSEKDRALMAASLEVLRQTDIPFREITPEEARKVEPALNPDTAFQGAVHLPRAEVGNCRQFALLLKNEAQRLGVQFAFSTTVEKIDTSTGMTLSIAGESAPRQFDAAIVCAGVDSHRLLRPLGIKIPLTAVHGYSVSASIREPLNAPRSAVVDERYKVAISRLGNRVRVAGSAEIGGQFETVNPGAIQTLYKVLHDWFPGAAQQSNGIQVWKGARPMLPDGPPLLGASGIPGLWLNLGHGSSGWALSCGSARALADLIGGKVPEIDLDGLGVERLRP